MRADRVGSIEHFNNQIYRSGLIPVGNKNLNPQQIIGALEGRLTADRVKRINHVLESRTFSVASVAEHLYDVGNISAVMRSAESFGFLPFHIIERTDAKYKKSDRISKGTEKWLDIRRHTSSASCFEMLKADGYRIYATTLETDLSIEDLDFSNKVAIVFGNEKEGISEWTQKNADRLFKIPMYGFAQSFNISVAAAITFSHIHRARKLNLSDEIVNLSTEEKEHIRACYYLRSIENPEVYFS